MEAHVRPARGQAVTKDAKTPCTDGTADAYPCKNIDLLSNLPVASLGGGGGTRLNDIWGWTDPQSGDEYAIIGRTDGTAFVDVSDPTNPVYLGELLSHSAASTWRDVKVYDNHAYIVSEAGDHGLQVFDLTQLRSVDNPPVTFDETAHYNRFSTAHNIALNRESGYAYVVGITDDEQSVPDSADCGAGLHMIDLRTPDQPEFAGCQTDLATGGVTTPGYTHDTQCVKYQGPDADYEGREICFNSNESQLNIADVTDKDAPETITNTTYPQPGYVHQAWLTEDQKYLLVDDELDESQGIVEKTRTLVFDVSDLDAPEFVKSFSGKTGAIDHNQYVKGRFSYQANYESGLRILNVSDPENPAEVGYFDTFPASNDASFNGAWSTYPFFDSGIIIVSSIGEGLFVLEPTFPPFGAPANLSAEVGQNGSTVDLQWGTSKTAARTAAVAAASGATDSLRYRIYRSTTPIDASSDPASLTPLDSVSIGTSSFTDTTATPRSTYYYRVTAVDTADVESSFSNEARAFLYPQQVDAAVNRSFGEAVRSSDYRLAALPGQGRRPLSDVIEGQAGADWQAYLDDGSSEDFLVRFDGSDRFAFQPGNGFWLIAQTGWSYADSAPTVDLVGDSVAQVLLRDGWNVISNPTDQDVAWTRVQAETPDTLQAIWDFDGSFSKADTFRSARTGRAYYFRNDDADRDTLTIPYPGAPGSKTAASSAERPRASLALTATPVAGEEASGSTVTMALDENAARGLGAEDLIAPPSRFEATSLRLEASDTPSSERARFLMAERRPPSAADGGQTFDLQLTSREGAPVRLTTQVTDALDTRSLVLIHPAAGATYDLHDRSSIRIEPEAETTTLQVAMGTEAYVESESSDALPSAVTLTTHPNPVREEGTLTYALPDPAPVTLRVYDVLGRQVARLDRGRKTAGRHTVRLDAGPLMSGVYFARLQAGDQTVTRKITVVR